MVLPDLVLKDISHEVIKRALRKIKNVRCEINEVNHLIRYENGGKRR